MRKILIACMSFVLLGFAGSALADKAEKQIRHCGCVYDSTEGASMEYHDVFVAGNSKGHRKHVVSGDDWDDECFAGFNTNIEPVYELWVRTAEDCEVGGDVDPDLLTCTTEQEEDPCGEEYVPAG